MSENTGKFILKYWGVITTVIGLVFAIGITYMSIQATQIATNERVDKLETRLEKYEKTTKKIDELSINIQFLFEKQGWKYFKIEDK